VLHEMAAGTRYSPQSPKLPPGVPADLANLIERCLREEAASRVQRMDEVHTALDRLRSVKAAGSHRARRGIKIIPITVVLAILVAARVWTWHAARNADPWMAWAPAPSAAPHKMDLPKMMDAGRMNEAPGPVAPPSPRPAVPRSGVATPVPRSAAVSPVRFVPPKPLPAPSLSMLASYPGFERDPSFSPDGANLAFSWNTRGRGGFGIYVRPVMGGPPVNLTDSGANDWGSAWSPEGHKIAFERRARESGIYWVDATGGPANLVAPIARPGEETLPQLSWSRDGKWIAAPDRDSAGATQIYLFAIESGERRALTEDAAGTNHAPAFSPDGKSLAYSSCRGAVFPCDVYVVDLDRNLAPKRRHRITEENIYVRGLAWLPDGRSLVYSAGQSVSTNTSLWRVSVNPPGLPERIDIAGSQARHPAISKVGGSLAFTRLGDWKLMMIHNFQ
jgi:Tol biopolymer transport system component